MVGNDFVAGGKEKLPFRTVKVSGGKKEKDERLSKLPGKRGSLRPEKRWTHLPCKKTLFWKRRRRACEKRGFSQLLLLLLSTATQRRKRRGGVCCCFSRGSDEKVRSFRTETQVLKFAKEKFRFSQFFFQ